MSLNMSSTSIASFAALTDPKDSKMNNSTCSTEDNTNDQLDSVDLYGKFDNDDISPNVVGSADGEVLKIHHVQVSKEQGDESSCYGDSEASSSIKNVHPPLHHYKTKSTGQLEDNDNATYIFHDHDNHNSNVCFPDLEENQKDTILEDSHTSYRRSLDNEITDIKLLFAEAQARADTLKNELALREKLCASTSSKLKEVSNQYEELRKRNNEITEVMNHLQTNANHSALERTSLLVKVEQAVTERERYVSRYKQFRNENRTLKKEREIFKGDIEELKSDNKTLKKENDKLKRQHEDTGYSTGSTHYPLSHYLNGVRSSEDKNSSRSSRRRRRMTKLQDRDFFRPPWTSSIPQSISKKFDEEESQDDSFFGEEVRSIKKITPSSSSRKKFFRMGDRPILLSESENEIVHSPVRDRTSPTRNVVMTTSRSSIRSVSEQEEASKEEHKSFVDGKPDDIQAGLGSEIYCKETLSPVSEQCKQTDKNLSRWNWFGSISGISFKQCELDGITETPSKRESSGRENIEGTRNSQTAIREEHTPAPIWLEGMSQILLPKRMASAGI